MVRGLTGNGWAQLFSAAFVRSRHPMLLLTHERVILRANHAFRDQFGYSDDQLIGRSASFLIAAAGRASADREWELVLHRDRVALERDILKSDGNVVHVDFAAHRATVDGHDLVLCVLMESTHPSVMRRPPAFAGHRDELSPREREVVLEIAMGYRLPEVATRLFVSTSTVRTHVRNAMQKLGAHSQAQLVAIALCEGIVTLSPSTAT